jgi:hypothetical protein
MQWYILSLACARRTETGIVAVSLLSCEVIASLCTPKPTSSLVERRKREQEMDFRDNASWLAGRRLIKG